MEKSENKERASKEGDYMPIIFFTAGTTFLVAAFVQRTVMLLLMERWRVWVFMAINLVLLAIFFTSNPSTVIDKRTCDSHGRDEPKNRERSSNGFPGKGEQDDSKNYTVEVDAEEEKSIEEKPETPRLSMEELNERVEAFIVMFKQHLVSDARKEQWKANKALSSPNSHHRSFHSVDSCNNLSPKKMTESPVHV